MAELKYISEMKQLDMETAPKDGTHIIAYGLHEDDTGRMNAGYSEVYYDKHSGWYHICGLPSDLYYWISLVHPSKDG